MLSRLQKESTEELENLTSQHLPETRLIDNTSSNGVFEDLVTAYYIPLEIWYTRTIIDKVFFFRNRKRVTHCWSLKQAHRLSSTDLSQSPITTTTPDDVFYILKSVTSRLLTTGSLTSVERMLEQLRDTIDQDYIGVIKKRLDEIYRNPGSGNSNVRPDRVERENRIGFIVSCQ